jgi:hypothetical protein
MQFQSNQKPTVTNENQQRLSSYKKTLEVSEDDSPRKPIDLDYLESQKRSF